MLVTLLIVLGVDLIVIAALAAFVVGRRRWLRRQPGEFAGAIRVISGEIDSLGPDWRRGSGRWVRDVFVWTKAPLLLSNVLIPVDQVTGQPGPTQLRRLGAGPIVVEFASNGARFQVASRAEHSALVLGPPGA